MICRTFRRRQRCVCVLTTALPTRHCPGMPRPTSRNRNGLLDRQLQTTTDSRIVSGLNNFEAQSYRLITVSSINTYRHSHNVRLSPASVPPRSARRPHLHNQRKPRLEITQECTRRSARQRTAIPTRTRTMVQAIRQGPLRRPAHPIRQQRITQDRDQDTKELVPQHQAQGSFLKGFEPSHSCSC